MLARLFPAVLATAAVAQQGQPTAPDQQTKGQHTEGQDAKIDFAQAIAPIFKARCYECHGPKEQEADLRLDQRGSVFHADETKWIIKPGKPAESELLRRVKLPKSDDEVMPAEGDPLSPEQIATIEKWIADGAIWPEGAGTGTEDTHTPTVETFELTLTATQKEQVDQAVAKLHERGAVATPIARDLVALDVNLSLLRPPAGDADLALAAAAAPALVWLNASRTQITDQGMAALATCSSVRRLHLAQTAIGDDGVHHLAGMRDLRFLNLFGTKVTDRGLEHLRGLAKLEKVFLWETEVTDAGVAALQTALPHLRIDRGGYAKEVLAVAAEQKATEATAKDALPPGVANSKCPVSGEAVDASVTVVHDGRTIAFCCTKCRAKFVADPAKFAPNLPAKADKK
ncbi:MAG: c-type cytochrome domain-containing protein [Planctomycetota bacterium]